MSYKDLKGEAILITGGANGIGQSTVEAFVNLGAHVYFCDMDVKKGQKLEKELGEKCFFTEVNLQREGEIKKWIKDSVKKGGKFRALVNNAAIDPRIPIEKTKTKDWDKIFSTNLKPYFLTSREILPHLQPNKGSIINLGSITYHVGWSELSAYVSTKGAISGFTRALAREVGPRGIRVNTVSPGWVMTERQLREHLTPKAKKWIKEVQCDPRLLMPEDIAEVILFLASVSSRAITGQTLLADKGWAHT